MKSDPESAKELLARLHKYSYGSNYTDNELVTRALRILPNEAAIICAFILLYHEAKKALPEYTLLILLSITVTTVVFCLLMRRKIKSLQAVQNIFLDAAPGSLDDALQKISEQVTPADSQQPHNSEPPRPCRPAAE